jgi:hypothetical protein
MVLRICLGCLLLTGLAGQAEAAGSDQALSVTGRLIDFEFDAPDCGTLRVVSLALYDQLEGAGKLERIFVAHPCVELPRRQVSAKAGNLERFVIGQRHRLELVRADPASLGALMSMNLDPAGQPVYLARKVDWVVDKPVDGRSVGDLNLGTAEAFPERLRPAVLAVAKSVGAPAEFWAQIEPDRKTGELVFHLWHQDAFLPANRDLLGNPGGKCRDVFVRRKDNQVTRSLFWQ